MNRLKVLQYNVQKSKDKVIALLLTDKAITLYNILVFQKLWQNPYKNAIYYLSLSVFYIVYNNQEKQSCFLINKNLDINSWDIDYSGPDIYSLRLQLPDITLWIYNFYNQLPKSYSIINYLFSLILLPELLIRKGKYLVLRDFNLYHPLWSSPRNPATHLVANSIIKILLAKDIELTTPKGIVT